MEKFSKDFLDFPHQIIVFSPDFEQKCCGGMYPFFPFEDMAKKFFFPKPMIENLTRILSGISGTCQKCGQSVASVAYFEKGILEFEFGGPNLHQVQKEPQYFCKHCALNKIQPVIQTHPEALNDNGLYLPYKGPGVFVNTPI